ncbi:septum formation initiator [Streptacidiphilus fuscans]|uniref:Septum formation initiator n=1 Tax=Streptacidiphilus fuscans TaxID=2789292 RepID=A0A931B5W7_9ACTN|nr:septum formation initiator [Streptacidiphilus fuscans]MBF9070989.1 septum formation initiator [Streptacidiphilus fuscans]
MAVGRGTARSRSVRAGRGPFALLVILLLSGGLIALLMLNTAVSQGSFTLSQLQQHTTSLQNEQQGLQQQIDGWSAPEALAARARGLGMVPGSDPAFLADNGTILGSTPAPLVGPPPSPTPSPTPQATASASASASASAKPSGTPSGSPAASAGARTTSHDAARNSASAGTGTVKPKPSAHPRTTPPAGD